MIGRLLAVVAVALALAGPAAACANPRTSLSYLEGQVMCPTCHTTLDQSDSPAAQRIEAFISKRIAPCATTQQIETALVANFGPQILAEPSHKGFDLLAWWLPIAGVARRCPCARVRRLALESRPSTTSRPGRAGSGLDDETERRSTSSSARFD